MKERKFYRIGVFAMLLALCLLMTACGKGGAESARQGAAPGAAATPGNIRFAAGEVEPGAQTLTMALASGETALLDSLTALRSADLSGSADEEAVADWAARHPGVQVRYTVTLPGGTKLASDTRTVDLSGMSADSALEAARKLALLPALESVNLGAEGGGFSWSDIARLREVLPKPVFNYAFKLYGRDCNLSDTKIDLYKVQITDDGRLIDEVMDYMPQLSYVDMDSCGLQPKRLEEINLRHPNAKVVFRVMFGDNYTARTDAERILASMASRGGMLNDSNVQGLYYCHDVKYLDLGHNTTLTNIGFVAEMPKLEVAILSMCNIADASPLAKCTELEYLEMSNTYCADVSPFSGLTKLRHLNVASIGYDQPHDGSPRIQLKDITPLYSLTGLERLWIGAYNPVPPEQIAEMQRRAPQCEINTEVYEDPVGGRWRYIALADYETTYVDTYHPRYIKLREQFGDYDYSAFNFTWNDPLYDANYAPSMTPAATPSPSPTPVVTPAPVYPTETPAVEPTPTPEMFFTPEPAYTPEPTFQPTPEPVYTPQPVFEPEPQYEEPYYEEPSYEEEDPYIEPTQPQEPTGDIVFLIPTQEDAQQFIQQQIDDTMQQFYVQDYTADFGQITFPGQEG